MSVVKSEKLPVLHAGLSPRGAPGVYRHSVRTRLWPKTWSKDTQSATSGTLFIQTPLDASRDFRQELWSYQGDNRGPPRSETHRLPLVPYRIRSSLELDTEETLCHQQESEAPLPVMPGSKAKPKPPNNQQRDSLCQTQAIRSVEKENTFAHVRMLSGLSKRSPVAGSRDKSTTMTPGMRSTRGLKAPMLTSRSIQDVSVMTNVFATLSGAAIRRLNGEESLAADSSKRRKWESNRHLFGIVGLHPKQTSGTKKHISIVGKLPTVQKGMLKTLQTLQREKYCSQGKTTLKLSTVDLETSMMEADDRAPCDDFGGKPKTGVNERDVAGRPMSGNRVQGQNVKLNPHKAHVSKKCVPKVEEKTNPHKPDNNKKYEDVGVKGNEDKTASGGEADGNIERAQRAIDSSVIIDSASYKSFERKPSPGSSVVLKHSLGGDDSSVSQPGSEIGAQPHTAHTMLGNSKCYPMFPPDGLSHAKTGTMKTPRKITKVKKV